LFPILVGCQEHDERYSKKKKINSKKIRVLKKRDDPAILLLFLLFKASIFPPWRFHVQSQGKPDQPQHFFLAGKKGEQRKYMYRITTKRTGGEKNIPVNQQKKEKHTQ